jgi:hypothetical protein
MSIQRHAPRKAAEDYGEVTIKSPTITLRGRLLSRIGVWVADSLQVASMAQARTAPS